MPKGKPEIEVTINIDANSIICVEILERSTRRENKMDIINDRERLGTLIIGEKIMELEDFDKIELEKEKAKINFDIYCYGIKEILNNQKIKNKLDELLNWRNNYPIATPEEYQSKKNEFINNTYSIMKKIYENNGEII